MSDTINIVHQLIATGNFREAGRLLTNALEKNPDSPELRNLHSEFSLQFGMVLWEKGDVEEALDHLLRALEANPSDRNTVLKCGEVLSDLDQIDAANSLYASYLKKCPGDNAIVQALQKLSAHSSVQSELSAGKSQQKEMRIQVSAIVSAYNSERFIRGCLEDLVNQTLYKKGSLEIVIIDSGSQQNEKTVVDEFRKRFENIVYVRTKRESIYAAWNRGIKLASGKYITNANTDDRHRPDAFEIMCGVLDRDPHIGLVYADVIVTATENETFACHTPSGVFRQPDYSRELLTLQCFIGPQPMWRKSLHKKYGYFDQSFTSSGDWEFWLRIAQGTTMLHLPELLGLFLHSPNIAEYRNIEKRTKEDISILNKYIPRYLGTLQDIETGMATVQKLEQEGVSGEQCARLRNFLMSQMRRVLSGQEKG